MIYVLDSRGPVFWSFTPVAWRGFVREHIEQGHEGFDLDGPTSGARRLRGKPALVGCEEGQFFVRGDGNRLVELADWSAAVWLAEYNKLADRPTDQPVAVS